MNNRRKITKTVFSETVIGWDVTNLHKWALYKRDAKSIRKTAKEIGISPTTLCRIERGNIPDMKTLQKVLAWLDCGLSFYEREIE